VVCTVVQVDNDRVDVVRLSYLPLVDAFSTECARENNPKPIELPTRSLSEDSYAERAAAVCKAHFQHLFAGTRVVLFVGGRREAKGLGTRLTQALGQTFHSSVFTGSATLPASHEMDETLVTQLITGQFELHAHLLTVAVDDGSNRFEYGFTSVELFTGGGSFTNGQPLRNKMVRLVIGNKSHPFHLVIEAKTRAGQSVWVTYRNLRAHTDTVRVMPVMALNTYLGWSLNWEGADEANHDFEISLDFTPPHGLSSGSRQTITQKCVLVIEADMGMRDLLLSRQGSESASTMDITRRQHLQEFVAGIIQQVTSVNQNTAFSLLFYHDYHDIQVLPLPPEFVTGGDQLYIAPPNPTTLTWMPPPNNGQPQFVGAPRVLADIANDFQRHLHIASEWYKPLEEAAHALNGVASVNEQTLIIWIGQSQPHVPRSAIEWTNSMRSDLDFDAEMRALREKKPHIIGIFVRSDVPARVLPDSRAFWQRS
jgi:hypothetical protein